MIARRAAPGLVALALAWADLGLAVEPVPLPPPGSEAWRPVEFPSIARHTEWRAERVGERTAWRAVADCAASGMALELDGIDLSRTPQLAWSWRAVRTPGPADERTREGDDFAARVYVIFPFEPARASLLERARRLVIERLYGVPTPGATLNFLWASQAEPGERWRSPYTGEGTMWALRSGVPEDAGWRRERVDLRRALARLPEPPEAPVSGLALMTDSDDTCTHAEAWYADFRFEGPSID